MERKNRKACIPCPRHDSVVSTSGNSDTVVPDSFENDVPQDPFPHADAAKAGQFSCGLNLSAQLPINVNAEVNTRLCHSEIREHGENLHNERQTALSDKPKRGDRFISELAISLVGTTSNDLGFCVLFPTFR